MIPAATPQYDQNNEARTREILRLMDAKNHKKGSDVELARNERLILTDSVTGQRYHLDIQSAAIVLVAV